MRNLVDSAEESPLGRDSETPGSVSNVVIIIIIIIIIIINPLVILGVSVPRYWSWGREMGSNQPCEVSGLIKTVDIIRLDGT